MSPLSEKAKRIACFIMLLLLAGLAAGKFLADYRAQGTGGSGLKQGVAYFYNHAACPGKPVEVVTLDYPAFSSTCRWSVGGKPVSHTGFSYTPTEADLEQMITATVEAAGYEPQTLSVYCSRLPVLYVDVDNGSDAADKHEYESAYYRLQGARESGGQSWEGSAQVKGRGNVS